MKRSPVEFRQEIFFIPGGKAAALSPRNFYKAPYGTGTPVRIWKGVLKMDIQTYLEDGMAAADRMEKDLAETL